MHVSIAVNTSSYSTAFWLLESFCNGKQYTTFIHLQFFFRFCEAINKLYEKIKYIKLSLFFYAYWHYVLKVLLQLLFYALNFNIKIKQRFFLKLKKIKIQKLKVSIKTIFKIRILLSFFLFIFNGKRLKFKKVVLLHSVRTIILWNGKTTLRLKL